MTKQIPVLVKEEIKNLREEIRWQEGDIRGDFRMRHNDPEYFPDERLMIKAWIRFLRSNRFTLQALEKQIPMPLKVCVKPCCFPIEGKTFYFCTKRNYCQNCGDRIFTTANGRRPEYCPHCGQKLWWPSC